MQRSRRSRVGRKRGTSLKRLKDACWRKFSEYIRLRDGPITVTCITCRTKVTAFGIQCAQAGHYVPGRSWAVLFDERNTHAQCWACNYVCHGRPIDYRMALIVKYGEGTVEELEANRNFVGHPTRTDFQMLEALLDELLTLAHNGDFPKRLVFDGQGYVILQR
jgi:hypothetical protein